MYELAIEACANALNAARDLMLAEDGKNPKADRFKVILDQLKLEIPNIIAESLNDIVDDYVSPLPTIPAKKVIPFHEKIKDILIGKFEYAFHHPTNLPKLFLRYLYPPAEAYSLLSDDKNPFIKALKNALPPTEEQKEFDHAKSQLMKSARTLVNNLIPYLNFSGKKNKDGKKHSASLLKDLLRSNWMELDHIKDVFSAKKMTELTKYRKFHHVIHFIISILDSESSPSQGKMGTILNRALNPTNKDEFNSELFSAYIADLKELAKSNGFNDEKDINAQFKRYTNVNSTSLLACLTNSFDEYRNYLNEGHRKFLRIVLPRSYPFISEHAHGFFANLRLCNRSQTRLRKNLLHAKFRFSDLVREWLFNKSQTNGAMELQKILSDGRKDKVLNLGATKTDYKNIYKLIEQLKQGFELSDEAIATALRNILNGKKLALSTEALDKLSHLTYLLFGCEATRNPAMHVINQMLLDLIIANETSGWTWEEALTGTKNETAQEDPYLMPMAPKGATASARQLNKKYSSCMPYPYDYAGTTDEKDFSWKELRTLEARVIRAWLEAKGVEKIINQIKLPKKRFAKLFANIIKSGFEHWFTNPIISTTKSHDSKADASEKTILTGTFQHRKLFTK